MALSGWAGFWGFFSNGTQTAAHTTLESETYTL